MSIENDERQKKIREVIDNNDLIIAQKQNNLQHGDNLHFQSKVAPKGDVSKAENGMIADVNKLDVELVINTTNVIDSHMDCHIPGLWTKSLNEMQVLFLLQEHEMDFNKVIADSVNDKLKATTRNISWSELGVAYPGTTQALIFSAEISKQRNEFMFNQYKNGYVLNHSVGMRYVKIFLCVDSNDTNDASYKENWDKFYPSVMNKDVADMRGYFYAVTEAKVVEGSAVVKGSNTITPVLRATSKEENNEIEAVKTDTSTTEAAESTSKTNTIYL